jgi:ureidoglycolate dehydrogenase (NAD+)
VIDQVLVKPAALHGFIVDLFVASDMARIDAALVAEILLWADRRGVSSHGVARLPRYLELIAAGDMDARARPHFEKRLGTTFCVDGRRAAGPVAMNLAWEHASVLAREQGVSFGTIANTTHTGAIGMYAQRIAETGCAAIIGAAGIPNMVYHGARVAGVSSAPFAIAIPGEPRPILLDMASSVVATGRLRQAVAKGEAIPAGWALTRDGTSTTDPKKAELPLPLGGPKGSGLALMFECLSGLLAGAPVLSAMLPPSADHRHRQSAFVLAVSVEAFQNLETFKASVTELRYAVHNLPKQAGFDEIFLPGERGDRAEAEHEHAVPVSAKSWSALLEAAESLKVRIPPSDL